MMEGSTTTSERLKKNIYLITPLRKVDSRKVALCNSAYIVVQFNWKHRTYRKIFPFSKNQSIENLTRKAQKYLTELNLQLDRPSVSRNIVGVTKTPYSTGHRGIYQPNNRELFTVTCFSYRLNQQVRKSFGFSNSSKAEAFKRAHEFFHSICVIPPDPKDI